MRTAFIETLVELANDDPSIVLLTADLGFMVLEKFAQRYPNRFFNVGVAEQNMLALATGLAEAGYRPFVYSITPFAVLRPYEFIRNGPILHQLPVRIVGVGAGMDYASNGLSHYSIEDIAVMRAQPGITIVAPTDAAQARTALRATSQLPGPIYYRVGKDDNVTIPGLDGRFELGHLQVIREGQDILFLTTGSITSQAVAAAADLEKRGISAAIAVIASIQPAPTEDLIALLSRYRVALTVEAHYRVGGIGSLVSEVVAENLLNCRIVRCGLGSTPVGEIGSQAYLHRVYGLDRDTLLQTALEHVELAPV